MGGREELSSFVGGGEVFIVPCDNGAIKAFRITKGQGIFPLSLEDKCWTCEIAHNDKAIEVPLKREMIGSRQELLEILQQSHGGDKTLPFIAKFDVCFEKEHLAARSNGIWPMDEVGEKAVTLFAARETDPVGGHLLGDSDSDGDQVSKHYGAPPLSGAKISLTPTQGRLEIIPIKKRVIALKEESEQFRAPLSPRELREELQPSPDHAPVVINGGGIAGVMTALKLAKLGIPCTIIERHDELLSGTSGRTPGRIGHGYHYRDLETAILYLQSSITFVRENCDSEAKRERFLISLHEDEAELDCGLYFIHKKSQVPAAELLKVYEGIREEYKRLVELDPKNKVFGEVEDFFQELDLEQFKDKVNIDEMAAVIRTQEKLLNWPTFSKHLLTQVQSYQDRGLISVVRSAEVKKIEYDQKSRSKNFAVTYNDGEADKAMTASYVVNATWENIEKLDSDLFPEAAVEERTNRMKLIATIEIAEGAESLPSMFTAMGPYVMFSNEGNGKGKITCAPVTNVLDYVIAAFKSGETIDQRLQAIVQKWIDDKELLIVNPSDPESWREIERQLAVQPLYKRWSTTGLSAVEQEFFGERILAGVVELYPALAQSKVIHVGAGIVKSNGEVNIYEAGSAFHKRDDHGLKERQIGYIDFNGVKLFYGESQSRNAVSAILGHMACNHMILDSMQPEELVVDVQSARNSFVRRYASEGSLAKGYFGHLDSRSGFSSANHTMVQFIRNTFDNGLNQYYQEPRLTMNLYSSPLLKVIQPVGNSIRRITKLSKSHACSEHEIVAIQQEVAETLGEIFTVFSIINEKGDIIIDGKYGTLDERVREEQSIPSLRSRDYVQEMMSSRGPKNIFCGSPVIGSTSGEFMIPVGVKLDDRFSLTFGLSIDQLTKLVATRDNSHVSRC